MDAHFIQISRFLGYRAQYLEYSSRVVETGIQQTVFRRPRMSMSTNLFSDVIENNVRTLFYENTRRL
jgi:hypothetical protein